MTEIILNLKRFLPPVPAVTAFTASLIYWVYLAAATDMHIVFDAVGYQDLGRLLQTQGFLPFFQTGPQREPLYPALIAVSMHLEQLTGFVHTKIMAGFGVIILFISQMLMYMILRRLEVRPWICAAVLFYFGFSPALTNTAFSLFSEIATYPFVLGIVLAGHGLWTSVKQVRFLKAAACGAALGLLFACAALTKAVFEVVFPGFVILFFTVLVKTGTPQRQRLQIILLSAMTAMTCFYAPIFTYKQLNRIHNGNFAITNRGSWMLYGTAFRRAQPLTFDGFLTALAYVPGEGVCNSLFGADKCRYWSFFQTDEFGITEDQRLINSGLSRKDVNAELVKRSKDLVLSHPFQYALLMTLEGAKMFFWESTQIGFVRYPARLQNIYDNKLVGNLLRLGMSLLTGLACLWMWFGLGRNLRSPIFLSMSLLTFLFIFFYALFCILTRYALPIAPLYLIAIGSAVDGILFWRRKT